MRRRAWAVILAASLVLAAVPALAVLPPAHQAGNNAYYVSGDCASCHIPHKAPAVRRGFPINPSATATYGYIGAFCMERCHLNVSGGTGDGGDLIYADTTGSVANNIAGGAAGALVGSHGLNLYASGGNAPYGTIVASSLPYGADGDADPMECTTCHNVHSDAADSSRALLQLDMDLLCIACHVSRVPAGFTDTWGTVLGSTNPGSHPVGTDVNDDSDAQANSGIRVGIPTAYGSTAFDMAYVPAANPDTQHHLGGHLWNGAIGTDASSPLSCVTCHQVHGRQNDPGDVQPPTTAANVSEDLLVIQQSAMGTAEPDIHANGGRSADTNNALCEGCHTHDGATTSDWNPGATSYSHPVDDMATSLNMGTIAAFDVAGSTVEWPFGTASGTANIGMGADVAGGGFRVLCESCHTPHPAANVAPASGKTAGSLYSGVPQNNTHILRRTETQLCSACHINTPPGHHPANVAEAPSANFGDAVIDGDADAILNCGDCHRNAGAHNWGFNHFPGLVAAWEPNNLPSSGWGDLVSDNGRSLYEASDYGTTTSQTPGTDQLINASASKECFDCHTKGRNPGSGDFSPTYGAKSRSNARYQNFGDGTHFLGSFATTYLDSGLYLGTDPFNAETGDWNSDTNITYYSRYGGTTTNPELVCESCHGLRIASFANGTNLTTRANVDALLVAGYSEGQSRQDTGGRVESGLCEGCHDRIAGGSGSTHVLSLDTVNRSSRPGYASGALTTATATGLADQGGAPNDGDYVATDKFNCDGCHQPHNGATNAGTMILDTAAANVPLATGVTNPRSNVAINLYGSAYSRSVAADHQWGKGQTTAGAKDSFCAQCHNW